MIKFSLQKEILKNALQLSNSIVNKKFIEDFKFQIMIKDKVLHIFSKNSNSKILYKIQTDIQDNITFSLDSNILLDVIKKFDEDEVSVRIMDSNQIKIYNTKSEFILFLNKIEDMPINFETDKLNYININASNFLDLLKKTEFAMSNENYRINLHGLNLKIHDDILSATALDGHRMAFGYIKLDQKYNTHNIIIPYKNVYDIINILQKESDIKIAFDDKQFFIQTENLIFQCSLVLSKFPDQTKLLDKKTYNKIVEMNTIETINSIDRVTTITYDKSKLIKLNLKDQEISIYGIEKGFAKEKLSTNQIIDIEIGFNAKYLQEALSKIESPKYSMHLNESNSSVLLSSKNNNTLFIIMPINLQ